MSAPMAPETVTAPPATTAETNAREELPADIALAFAPIHKFAMGVATGVAAAILLALTTIAWHVVPAAREFPLYLLSEYFYGYTEAWSGVLIATGWGFVVGFVAGWFAAFSRNLALGISAFWITTRNELAETRDFLDHI